MRRNKGSQFFKSGQAQPSPTTSVLPYTSTITLWAYIVAKMAILGSYVPYSSPATTILNRFNRQKAGEIDTRAPTRKILMISTGKLDCLNRHYPASQAPFLCTLTNILKYWLNERAGNLTPSRKNA